MDYGYIYKTTNLVNGRIYIGQHEGTFSPEYLGSGKILTKAIIKYGKNNFRLEVLAFATTRPMLNGLEMKYIYEYQKVFGKDFLYNIISGGAGGGIPHSEETKNKISHAHIGIKHSEETKKKIGQESKSRKHSQESKLKISKALTGLKRSDETKHKISLIGMGRKFSDETKNKISKALIGHETSIETRNKIGLAHKNKIVSDDAKRKMSIAKKGKPAWNKGKKLGFIPKGAFKKGNIPWNKLNNNDTQATGSNIVPPLIGAQNRLQEKAVKVS